MNLVKITDKDTSLLKNFLENAGNSLDRFRYFSSRSFDVLRYHLVTYILEENGQALAYGHLDKEKDTVWLGTCVIEKEKGKGLGKKMMEALIAFARKNNLEKIKLSVDNVNEAAQKLYVGSGFKKTDQLEKFSFYEWNLIENAEIFVSTLALIGKSAEEIISIAKENNFAIEFSSGMPFRADMEKVFLEAPIKKYAHNYFPAPEKPFVLNLASKDDATRKRSIQHCVNGMHLSAQVNAKFFSAHAGFCIDPKPEELGQQLSRDKNIDRPFHWNLFLNSVKEVLEATKHLKIKFLVENNVLAKMNVYEDGFNPLFCADPKEMIVLVEEINDPRLGILLDTAHLKVSALTLGFNKNVAVKNLEEVIGCVHHSDNEGEFDNNLPLTSDYWFLEHMRGFYGIPHVIEVKKISIESIKAHISLLKNQA